MNEHNSTLNYYNQFAQDFINNTFNADVSESLNNFMQLLPPNASVLDVGCGSGRDTLTLINNGFNVTAFDASPALAKLAQKTIQHPVIIKNIEDMSWNNEFDAVWAMASLLHLKKEELPNAIEHCIQALKKDSQGFFFASFKMGNGEGYDDKGRYFSYYQEQELKDILLSKDIFTNLSFTINEDTLGRPGLSWISFIAEKPSLKLNNKKRFKF